jgi:hypothetical protein
MTSVDLLFHPVRLRIVKAFLGDRALTTSQLARELGDVPAGSLYRHVALLQRAGVLQVVAERRVRGAVERTYTMRVMATRMTPDDIRSMSPGEHAHAFMIFAAGLLADFDRYLAEGPPDFVRDGVQYSGAAMWLTDAEYRDFVADVVNITVPRYANPPGPGRKRRMVYSVFLPAPESGDRHPGAGHNAAPPGTGRKRSPQ